MLKNTTAHNKTVTDLLRRRAREKGRARRWNHTVMLAYVVLAAMIVLSLELDNSVLLGLVAILGLAGIWGFSRWQSGRMEREIFDEEMTVLDDLASPVDTDRVQTAFSEMSAGNTLSDRELEVLARVASGKSNKQIAQILHISEQTVKNHISHIFEKLDVSDRTSAVMHAMDRGWLERSSIPGD